tara:strand:+ start:1866 stop:3125 length:1260 start_codon:yes stop_codon:yes gene_type:complete
VTDSAKEIKEAFEAAKAKAEKTRSKNDPVRERLRGNPKLQRETKAALIEDLRRVFNSPDNPFKGFAASRARYKDLGHFPEVLVHDFFGNHTEFLRAAGLADLRTTTKVRNRAARLHSHQQIAEFAERHILRFTDRFMFAQDKRDHLEILIASDLHSHFCDPFALEVFLDACAMVQPDIICINGDGVDFPAFSRHRELPGHFHMTAWEECLWFRDLLAKIRNICPKAQIDFVIGNHEYRLTNYLADSAPALASFPALSFDKIFNLEESQVNLVCRSSFLAPTASARSKDVRENWVVYGDSYVCTHGTSCAKFAAQVQLDRFKMCGTSGHTHRPQIFHDNSFGSGPLSWMSTPMMAHASVGSDYMPDPTKWNGGFGHAAVYPAKGLVSQELVIVHPDWCSWAGRTWKAAKKTYKARDALKV